MPGELHAVRLISPHGSFRRTGILGQTLMTRIPMIRSLDGVPLVSSTKGLGFRVGYP